MFGETRTPRLDVAHYSSKQRVATADSEGSFSHRRVPLGALYAIAPQAGLGPATRFRTSERTGRESVLGIIGATFYLDVTDGRRAREGFELAAEAARSCPVRLLTFPWNLGALDSVAAAIVDDLRR